MQVLLEFNLRFGNNIKARVLNNTVFFFFSSHVHYDQDSISKILSYMKISLKNTYNV